MVAWSLKVTVNGVEVAEWFEARFARARQLLPAAEFDTIIRAEFQDTITCELADTVGVATASPGDENGGVVAVAVGDSGTAPDSGRLQLTDPPNHVAELSGRYWYAASLVKIVRPPDGELGDTLCDAIGLWATSNDNRVGLGIGGNLGSGSSTTNWVGYAIVDASVTTVLGPALDGEEDTVWHLFEAWFDLDAGELHFAIDGEEFASTIDGADLPALPATLAMISERTAAGSQTIANYDKATVVVTSPRVGEP